MESFIPGFKERALREQIETLICYIWDNFLQLYETEEIFLMGVGNAYLGVKVLLINRGKHQLNLTAFKDCLIYLCLLLDCKDRIGGIVNFVTGNLRPVKSDTDEYLSTWYKEHSRVYVAGDHACWSDHDLTRKVQKRRFGTVVRSEKHGLNRMMQAHAKEAQEWIMDKLAADETPGDTTEEEREGEE